MLQIVSKCNFCYPEVTHVPWNMFGYCVMWLFMFVSISVCCRFGLCPFRSVANLVCGRFGLWSSHFLVFPLCGRFGLWLFQMWPFRSVAVLTCYRANSFKLYIFLQNKFVFLLTSVIDLCCWQIVSYNWEGICINKYSSHNCGIAKMISLPYIICHMFQTSVSN